MRTFANLLLISIACFVCASCAYNARRIAEIEEYERLQQEYDRRFQKFERMELYDLVKDGLIKDESLYLEYEHFYQSLRDVDTWWLRHTWLADRYDSLISKMGKILNRARAVKAAEQGDIDARVYLASHKAVYMSDLAIFNQKFDKLAQIQRDKSWNGTSFAEFVELYADVKFKQDFAFFEVDSLYQLDEIEYDIYVDRINKIALSVVEWIEDLDFDDLSPKESKAIREKHKEFSGILSI